MSPNVHECFCIHTGTWSSPTRRVFGLFVQFDPGTYHSLITPPIVRSGGTRVHFGAPLSPPEDARFKVPKYTPCLIGITAVDTSSSPSKTKRTSVSKMIAGNRHS
uniref:Uncharacterized protein n=1 Tax=Steinernema glaseri TaxID=37863 RepID=A0A1I7Y3M1_9BILA